MIGQEFVLESINNMILNNTFPRCVLLIGKKGQGKKTLAKEISQMLDYPLVLIDKKIDNIRDMINTVNNKSTNLLFTVSNIDDMPINAQNSLLKTLEEPPNNAFFILTAETEIKVLETIKNRVYIVKMAKYSENDVEKFIELNNINLDYEEMLLFNIATNNYEVMELYSYGVLNFYSYVKKVIDNIVIVSDANALKITQKLKLSSDKGEYDFSLFLKTYAHILRENMKKDYFKGDDLGAKYFYSMILITETLNNLMNTNISKLGIADDFILKMRTIGQR